MLKPTEAEQKDIFELIHRRRKKSSTIFCSQVHWDGWYEQLGGDASPLADAILDRIVYDAYRIHIQAIDSKNDKSILMGRLSSLCVKADEAEAKRRHNYSSTGIPGVIDIADIESDMEEEDLQLIKTILNSIVTNFGSANTNTPWARKPF